MGEIESAVIAAQAAVALVVILLIVLVILQIRLSLKVKKMKKNYDLMMRDSGTENLEGLLIELQNKIASLTSETVKQQEELAAQRQLLRKMKGNVAVSRYNAFSGQGNDLSFSIAMVDEEKDGVVISGIHNREETYVYAKPLAKGESSYPLTNEEKAMINQAVQSKG